MSSHSSFSYKCMCSAEYQKLGRCIFTHESWFVDLGVTAAAPDDLVSEFDEWSSDFELPE